jgi:hypothetical protein
MDQPAEDLQLGTKVNEMGIGCGRSGSIAQPASEYLQRTMSARHLVLGKKDLGERATSERVEDDVVS